MLRRLAVACTLAALTLACGGSSSPAAPTPVAQTRIINVSGDLAFGTVNIGTTATKTFTISNSGNATLTYTGMTGVGGTGTAGYAVSPTSGTIAAGSSQTVTIQFTPTLAQFYSNVLTVASDKTDGNNAINVSGTGLNNNPIFTISGKGNTVFTLPSYVGKVHVTGHFVDTGSTSNFIVQLDGHTLINEILRNADYDGIHLTTGGGVISIISSASIAWSFTEVR